MNRYALTLTTPVRQRVEVDAEHEGDALKAAYLQWHKDVLYGTACANIEQVAPRENGATT